MKEEKKERKEEKKKVEKGSCCLECPWNDRCRGTGYPCPK